MEIDSALRVLNLVRPGGGGRIIDLQRNPRAFGTMGLAPFEVEATAVNDSRRIVDEYLAQFPEGERAEKESELWADFMDMQRIRESRVDLSFLDKEFEPLPPNS
jgi:hypothetical protein